MFHEHHLIQIMTDVDRGHWSHNPLIRIATYYAAAQPMRTKRVHNRNSLYKYE